MDLSSDLPFLRYVLLRHIRIPGISFELNSYYRTIFIGSLEKLFISGRSLPLESYYNISKAVDVAFRKNSILYSHPDADR
jgi:hypothetical protein